MPETHELTIGHDQDLYESFELADEQQIIAEISGRVTDKYVYELKGVKDQSGNPVNGLSYAGTNWACREYAKQGEVIRIVDKDFRSDPTNDQYIIVVVTAQRFSVHPETGKEIALDSTIGIKRQWRMMKKKRYVDGQEDGYDIVEDPFFWEKACSKAIRNAKQGLIPVDIVKKLISEALNKKNGQDVHPRQGGSPKQQQRNASKGGGGAAASGGQQGDQKPPGEQKQAEQKQTEQKTAQGTSSTTPPPSSAGPENSSSAASASGGTQEGAGKQKASRDVLNQKFEAILKQAFKTQDGEQARAGLAKLTGIAKISDLPDDKLKDLGNLLHGVIKNKNKIDANKILSAEGQVLWKGPEPASAAGAAPPPADAPPEDKEFNPF